MNGVSLKITTKKVSNHTFSFHAIYDAFFVAESCVSIHACDITKLNDQPIRMLQDYFVHISRLFPESMSGLGKSAFTTCVGPNWY